MRNLLAALFLCLLFPLLRAQPYQHAGGIRVGSANGVSWHQFLGRSHTGIETMLVHYRGGARVVGMLTQHFELGRNSQSYLYLGGGAHAGMTGILIDERANQPAYGVDLMVGFQYFFPYAPFAVSFDLKPMLEFEGGTRISGNNAGVTLRYFLE